MYLILYCYHFIDDIVKVSLEADSENSDSEGDGEKLLPHIQRKVAKGHRLCTPKREQNVNLTFPIVAK